MMRISYFPKVLILLFCFIVVAQASVAQIGLAAGWVASKMVDKSSWKKFKDEQTVSHTVLHGDTLFCMRTSAEGLHKLSESRKYNALCTVVQNVEYDLNNMYKRVQYEKEIENNQFYNAERSIASLEQKGKGFNTDYYRKEVAFYTRYQAAFVKRKKEEEEKAAQAWQARMTALEKQEEKVAVAPRESQAANVVYGGMDAGEVKKIYGSVDEYNQQYMFKRKSSHGYLVLFAGKSTSWVNELSLYLQDRGWSVVAMGGVPSARIINLSKGCYGCVENTLNITLTIYTDVAKDQTKKLVINGKGIHIEQLFVEYWDLAEMRYDQLREKGVFYYSILTDRVTLKSKPEMSTITITANTN